MYNLIINEKIILEQNGEIIEQYDNSKKETEGNIYLAKVKTVLNAMEESFVDIGTGKNALLRSKEYKPNTKLIVQVKKSAIGRKGAIVTDKIQIRGKYIILLPTEKYVSISNKITNIEEQKRLKMLVQNNIKEYGAIIRTLAENEEKRIIQEINELSNLWNQIKAKANILPELLYEENQIEKVIKGLTEKNISKIITDNLEETKKIIKKLNIKIPIEMGENYIKPENTEKRIVWLKSGAYITIDNTEALVAIDVNSGSYTGKGDFEQTAEKINKEASVEIAKQIRLRNLRGIIIIDYINMCCETTKQDILEIMEREIKKDRSKVDIYGFTKLGLLEISRKQL